MSKSHLACVIIKKRFFIWKQKKTPELQNRSQFLYFCVFRKHSFTVNFDSFCCLRLFLLFLYISFILYLVHVSSVICVWIRLVSAVCQTIMLAYNALSLTHMRFSYFHHHNHHHLQITTNYWTYLSLPSSICSNENENHCIYCGKRVCWFTLIFASSVLSKGIIAV